MHEIFAIDSSLSGKYITVHNKQMRCAFFQLLVCYCLMFSRRLIEVFVAGDNLCQSKLVTNFYLT